MYSMNLLLIPCDLNAAMRISLLTLLKAFLISILVTTNPFLMFSVTNYLDFIIPFLIKPA
jgi:hypothetical protein